MMYDKEGNNFSAIPDVPSIHIHIQGCMQQGKKVLIIDDEIDLCLLLKSYFLRKDYEVYVSHTLTTGIQQLNESIPDILFIDNNLPDGTGWEVVPSIAVKYPEISFYLLSAFHPTPPKMPLPATCHIIEKPVSFSELDKLF